MRKAGINAPLMIMRGDGGVMDSARCARPVDDHALGPAASVAGALMYLRVSDGIYFEVGGTSTNIGVIRNGQPTDGVCPRRRPPDLCQFAGRARRSASPAAAWCALGSGKLVDVGPRSAHIAAFPTPPSPTEDIVDPKIE